MSDAIICNKCGKTKRVDEIDELVPWATLETDYKRRKYGKNKFAPMKIHLCNDCFDAFIRSLS